MKKLILTLASMSFLISGAVQSKNLTAQLSNHLPHNPGMLAGIIVDPLGARISKAVIVIEKGSFKRELNADDEGFFHTELPEGVYKVEVKAIGFKPISQNKILIKSNKVAAMNLELTPLPPNID